MNIKFTRMVYFFLFLLTACNGNNSTNKPAEPSKETTEKINKKNFISLKADITAEEALALLKSSALLIDVREPAEIKEIAYDVKNFKNIPLDELPTRLAEVPKDIQVILACRSGGRSGAAYDLLKKNGFENISNMVGGMNAWSEKTLPVIKGGK